MVLPELIGRGRRAHPDRAALVFGDEARTHAGLHERAARLATVLEAEGVGRGDRVALLLHNGFEFVESLLAIHMLGAVAVPINFRLTADEIAYILRDSGAVALIEAGSHEERVAAAAPRAEQAELAEDDPALIVLHVGHDRPAEGRGAHARQPRREHAELDRTRCGAGADDVWLSGMPLFHIGGINGLLPFLALGATSVVTPTTGFDPVAAIERIERHGVTMCIFVPTQWDEICACDEVQRMDRERLRVAMWAASPATRATLERLGRTFPSAAIVSAYGQTEMSGATTLLKGPDATRKMGSVGKPMRGVELRVVDERLRDVAAGEVGEIVYRGPNVMAGYHGNPEATAEAFAGGWFHSGDLARLDDEGYLWLVDRKKDLIISGGENVYPAEVERVLREHPAVAEAAVVGRPAPALGRDAARVRRRQRGGRARRS